MPHEERTRLLYRAVFGERDPKTLKRRAGLQDDMQMIKWMAALLITHAFGLPTDKVGELIGKAIAFVSPAASAGGLVQPMLPEPEGRTR